MTNPSPKKAKALKRFELAALPPAEKGELLLAELSLERQQIDVEKCLLLIRNGAMLENRDASGCTPLSLAANKRLTPVAEALILAGAAINTQNSSGNTPAIYAATCGAEDILNLLIAACADLNRGTTTANDTALHLTARANQRGMASMLIAAKADLNRRNNFGETPLITAVRYRREEMACEMIAAGAHVALRANDGSTVEELARQNGMKKVLQALMSERQYHAAGLPTLHRIRREAPPIRMIIRKYKK